MSPIDTYRDAFLGFLKEGMTHAEALDQFDPKEWNAAVVEELYFTCIDPITFDHVTNDERKLPSLLSLGSLAHFQRRSQRDFEEQAVPLMLAGWTMEPQRKPYSDSPWSIVHAMSLYWRAPSKRPGKPGRRYLSTQQAFNAMMRSESGKNSL